MNREQLADHALNGAATPPACGACRYWGAQPRDPADLAAPRQGQCRRLPPVPLLLGTDRLRGPITLVTYPTVPDGFPACALYEPALAGAET